MKPYTLTISGTEQSKIYAALQRGLFCAKEQQKAGVIGAAAYIHEIEASLEIMNRPCDGGFETDEERKAAVMADWAADAAMHNNN